MTTTRFLRLPAVMELTGLGRDSIYRLGKAGIFPKRRKLTERASAWREDELLAWIDSRPQASPADDPAKREATHEGNGTVMSVRDVGKMSAREVTP